MIESGNLRTGLPAADAGGEFLERELKVEDQAEALETMATRVEAKEKQFVLFSELPGNALPGRLAGRARSESALDVKVEARSGFSTSWCNSTRGGLAPPWAMIVVGGARDEADARRAQLRPAPDWTLGDQQIEVTADAQRALPP